MDIRLDKSSVNWFHRELSLTAGDAVRFFVRYGGESSVHPGFSLGMCVEEPKNVATSVTSQDIVFFVRDEDSWYFDGNDLFVYYDPLEDGIHLQVEAQH